MKRLVRSVAEFVIQVGCIGGIVFSVGGNIELPLWRFLLAGAFLAISSWVNRRQWWRETNAPVVGRERSERTNQQEVRQ